MAQKLVEAFSDLPDDAAVTLKQINEESIHQHNAFAERTAKMGELRAELASIKGLMNKGWIMDMEIEKITGPLRELLREREIIARCELLLRTYDIVRAANLSDQEHRS